MIPEPPRARVLLPVLDGRTALTVIQTLENVVDAIWDAHRAAINEIQDDLSNAHLPPVIPAPVETTTTNQTTHCRPCLPPHLAILTALKATLATTVAAMSAAHPEISRQSDLANPTTIEVETAAALANLAGNLIAIINRYRASLLDPASLF